MTGGSDQGRGSRMGFLGLFMEPHQEGVVIHVMISPSQEFRSSVLLRSDGIHFSSRLAAMANYRVSLICNPTAQERLAEDATERTELACVEATDIPLRPVVISYQVCLALRDADEGHSGDALEVSGFAETARPEPVSLSRLSGGPPEICMFCYLNAPSMSGPRQRRLRWLDVFLTWE